MKYSILLVAVLIGGCSLAPSDQVLSVLAQSERSWCLAVSSVYGTMKAGGTGVRGGSMSCTSDGLSVKDGADAVGVPIMVVPQISVGEPLRLKN